MTIHRHIPAAAAGARARRLGKNVRRAVVGAAVALALAACGSAPSITLTLDSASAELLRGAEVQIDITLARLGGANADVTLTVTGLPANVAGSFSTVTLSGGTLTSTLTLSADAAATEGDYTVSVTGTGTGLSDTAELALDVVSLSVTGRVVSIYDLPVVGVAVGSQGDTEITDANGAFELTGLSVPYDLSVWNTAESWVQIYEGLTADELLLAPLATTPPSGISRSATVSGNLSGGVIPVAANQTVTICVEGVDGVALGCDSVAPTESSYSINVQWLGGTSRQVRLHALQAQRDVTGYPVSYQGYASMAMTLTDGVPTVANVDLGAALTTTTVTVGIDASVPILATVAAVQLTPTLALPVMVVSSPAASHDVLLPVIDDVSYSFMALASITHFGWQAGVTGATATVVLPALPTLQAPADLATNVTTATNFTVSNPTDGPVTYMWDADASDLAVAVTTMASSHRIPDLSAYGLELPAGADFSWQVLGHSGTSTESGTGAFGDYFRVLMLVSGSSGSGGPVGEGTFALGDGREFTTAP